MSMTQTNEVPGYELSGSINGTAGTGYIGDWKLDVIQGDNVTLDVSLSMSSTVELNAAIEALIALRDTMAQAEQFRGER